MRGVPALLLVMTLCGPAYAADPCAHTGNTIETGE